MDTAAPVAADTSAAATPASGTAAAPAAPVAGTPAADELIELLIEEGKPPVKVPRSKLDPHLSKYRSETDKLRSEYDKNAKALADQRQKLEAVLKAAKEDPEGTMRELGIDPDAYAEARLAARVREALRAEEEKADPTKKTARERDEENEQLRKDNDKLKKDQAERDRASMKGRIQGALNSVKAKLPEALREDATPTVLAVFRQALAEKRDISIDDAARATLSLIRARAKAAYEADPELRSGLGAPVKPDAKVIEHPAARAAPRAPNGTFKPADMENGAGDVLRQMMRGKFK